MPRSLSLAVTTFLFGAAVIGWALVVHFGAGLVPVAEAPDQSLIEKPVKVYLMTRIEVEASGERFERVEPYLTGRALAAFRAESQAKPAPVKGLALVKINSARVLWREANQAMAEIDYLITSEATGEQRQGEHLLLEYQNGRWLISAIWRVQPDPGTPLVPPPPTPAP